MYRTTSSRLSLLRTQHEPVAALSREQQNSKALEAQITQMEHQLDLAQSQLQVAVTPQSPGSPIPLVREQIFYDVLRSKLQAAPGRIVEARGKRGRTTHLMVVPAAEKSSTIACHDTVKKRSQAIETYVAAISAPSSASNTSSAAIAEQIACAIRRDSATFLTAANAAGLRVFAKFTMNQLAAIGQELPMSMIIVLKHLFKSIYGFDPFGPVAAIRSKMFDVSFQHECGERVEQGGKMVTFLCVTDPVDVIKRTVKELHAAGELDPLSPVSKRELRLMLSVDKGGASTKMMLQVLDTKMRHSTRRARLLAFFEGGKDSHENMREIFSPIFSCLADAIEKGHLLGFSYPPTNASSVSAASHKPAKTLQALEQLGFKSVDCVYVRPCKHLCVEQTKKGNSSSLLHQ